MSGITTNTSFQQLEAAFKVNELSAELVAATYDLQPRIEELSAILRDAYDFSGSEKDLRDWFTSKDSSFNQAYQEYGLVPDTDDAAEGDAAYKTGDREAASSTTYGATTSVRTKSGDIPAETKGEAGVTKVILSGYSRSTIKAGAAGCDYSAATVDSAWSKLLVPSKIRCFGAYNSGTLRPNFSAGLLIKTINKWREEEDAKDNPDGFLRAFLRDDESNAGSKPLRDAIKEKIFSGK